MITLYGRGEKVRRISGMGSGMSAFVARPVELIIKNNISYKECTYIPTLCMRTNTLHYSPYQKKAGPYVS